MEVFGIVKNLSILKWYGCNISKKFSELFNYFTFYRFFTQFHFSIYTECLIVKRMILNGSEG